MDKRYLYRAKHIHVSPKNQHLPKRWIEGFLAGERYMVPISKDDIASPEKLIDPHTIGLCSGKTDKEGTDIFEGDILENDNGGRFEVRYGQYAMYCPVDDCMMQNVGFYTVMDGYYEDMPLGPTEQYARVIGNIHDNPELRVADEFGSNAELDLKQDKMQER